MQSDAQEGELKNLPSFTIQKAFDYETIIICILEPHYGLHRKC